MIGSKKALSVLVVLIVLLSTVCAFAGLMSAGQGHDYEFRTLRGETVAIRGEGLYRWDTVNMAAQALGQDLVTLAVAVPLLAVSALLARKGSLRAKLLLAGSLGYFLYTYATYALNLAFNELYVFYVALMGLSLFAFIIAIADVDGDSLRGQSAEKFPRKTISIVQTTIGVALVALWGTRIVAALASGQPPEGLESYHTLVIQALDLAFVVPAALLSAVLVWRRRAWGYVLSSVVLIKVVMLALAVCAMAVNQTFAGVKIGVAEALLFPAMVLIGLLPVVMLMRGVSGRQAEHVGLNA